MWSEAAKELAKFPEAVLSALDPEGYPVSVRQSAPRYDPAAGRFTVVWPPDLPVAEGLATVLCHYHDEKLWNIKQLQIKGRLEREADHWVFTSSAFRRPPRSQLTRSSPWAGDGLGVTCVFAVGLWGVLPTCTRSGERR